MLLFLINSRDFNEVNNVRSLFFNCKNEAELPIWYKRGKVTPSYRSKHTLITLHVWMINRRLLKENEEGKSIQEKLFDVLWTDTNARIRQQGINELSVILNLNKLLLFQSNHKSYFR